MYYSSPEELKGIVPFYNGIWNKEYLYEYLVWHSNKEFKTSIDDFFKQHCKDEDLINLLFSFLLDEEYDGSDRQMGAARIISQMDKGLLKNKKNMLLQAQKNEVYWKRPFLQDEYLEWID